MANQEQMKILMQGVDAWNEWRQREPMSEPDLQQAHLEGLNLREADFRWANLAGANLRQAALSGANLFAANLQRADLSGAHLGSRGSPIEEERFIHAANLAGANLREANLNQANLVDVDLTDADLREADISGADLNNAHLSQAKLSYANLQETRLSWAMLFYTDLTQANLREANLEGASLHRTDLTGADLSRCRISSAQIIDVRLKDALQQDLLITAYGPVITVDDLEVSQLVIAFLDYPRLREVVKSITTELALIIGDFADERAEKLATLKGAVREQNYLPLALDCAGVKKQEIITYLTPLASLARFIFLDLTGMKRFGEDLHQFFAAQRQAPMFTIVQAGVSEESLIEQVRAIYSMLHVQPYTASNDLQERAREMIKLAGQKT